MLEISLATLFSKIPQIKRNYFKKFVNLGKFLQKNRNYKIQLNTIKQTLNFS